MQKVLALLVSSCWSNRVKAFTVLLTLSCPQKLCTESDPHNVWKLVGESCPGFHLDAKRDFFFFERETIWLGRTSDRETSLLFFASLTKMAEYGSQQQKQPCLRNCVWNLISALLHAWPRMKRSYRSGISSYSILAGKLDVLRCHATTSVRDIYSIVIGKPADLSILKKRLAVLGFLGSCQSPIYANSRSNLAIDRESAEFPPFLVPEGAAKSHLIFSISTRDTCQGNGN